MQSGIALRARLRGKVQRHFSALTIRTRALRTAEVSPGDGAEGVLGSGIAFVPGRRFGVQALPDPAPRLTEKMVIENRQPELSVVGPPEPRLG